MGKSAAGNTILGTDAFEEGLSPSSQTSECQKAKGLVGGRPVAVIDTPGLFDTELSPEEVWERIKMCISRSAPGPHAFLVVLQVGSRFTDEERETIKMIRKHFGKDAAKYTMVLFTHGDKLQKKKKTIESYISESSQLRTIVHECNDRYHVFNNEIEDPEQTRQLLEKINKMTLANGGSYYTSDMFQRAEAAIEKEKERLVKEAEAKKKKELEKAEAAIEKEKQRLHKEAEAQKKKVVEEAEAAIKKEKERAAKEAEKVAEAKMKKELEERMAAIEKEKQRQLKEAEAKKKEELDKLKAEQEEKRLKVEEELKREKEKAREKAEKSNDFLLTRVLVGAVVGGAVGGVAGAGGAVLLASGPIGWAALGVGATGAVVGGVIGAILD